MRLPFDNDFVIIGIVGSRRRCLESDYEIVKKTFDDLFDKYNGNVTIVSGGCKTGADQFAERIAKEQKIMILIRHPNLLGKNRYHEKCQAYYDRNEEIAKDADILIACVAGDRTGGTENTIKHFIKLGKESNLILV